MNAYDCARFHRFQAGFQQQLLQKRITDLHVRPFLLRFRAELFAGHSGAVNAVASGLGAHVNHRIPRPRRPRVKNLVATGQAQGESIHQRIAGIAIFKTRLTAQVGYAEAISVRGDPADYAFQNGMVLVNRRIAIPAGRSLQVGRSL